MILQWKTETFVSFIKNTFLSLYSKLISRNKELRNQLYDEIKKNKTLKNEILELEKEIKKVKEEKNDIIHKNNELQKLIDSQKKELNELKSKLNDNSIDKILPGEKILAVGFSSYDKKVNFCLPCKNTDLFIKLEEKLYNNYPDYKEKETFFIANGMKIKRFKTLEENNIKSGCFIMLNIYE